MSNGESSGLERRPSAIGRAMASAATAEARNVLAIAVLLALALVANLASTQSAEHVASARMAYWVPVIAASAVLGTLPGLAFAAAAIAAVLAVGLAPAGPGEDVFAHALRIWHEPILWIAAALVIGELRRHHMGVRDELVATLRSFDRPRRTIADHCLALQSHADGLERLLAAQPHVKSGMLEALRDLRDCAPSGLGPAVERAAAALAGTRRVALYARRGPGVECIFESGTGEAARGAVDPAIEELSRSWPRERNVLVAGLGACAPFGGNARALARIGVPHRPAVLIALADADPDLAPASIELALQLIADEAARVLARGEVVVALPRAGAQGAVAPDRVRAMPAASRATP